MAWSYVFSSYSMILVREGNNKLSLSLVYYLVSLRTREKNERRDCVRAGVVHVRRCVLSCASTCARACRGPSVRSCVWACPRVLLSRVCSLDRVFSLPCSRFLGVHVRARACVSVSMYARPLVSRCVCTRPRVRVHVCPWVCSYILYMHRQAGYSSLVNTLSINHLPFTARLIKKTRRKCLRREGTPSYKVWNRPVGAMEDRHALLNSLLDFRHGIQAFTPAVGLSSCGSLQFPPP